MRQPESHSAEGESLRAHSTAEGPKEDELLSEGMWHNKGD